MAYLYGLLRNDISPAADRHNDELLGPNTLGIEVTSKPLAERCALGNIDPQHKPGGGSSAIEEALNLPRELLPPNGTRLVTMRPDKDSIGAMAILSLRGDGKEHLIDKSLVVWTGACDRTSYRIASEFYPELAEHFKNDPAVFALNVICRDRERWPNLAQKVMWASWVLSGKLSNIELEMIKAMWERKSFDYSHRVKQYGDLAFIAVEGELDQARSWANNRFPVALIYDTRHSTHGGSTTKWSLVKRPSEPFDRWRFEKLINAAEARARGMSVDKLDRDGLSWGGTPTIVSSPAGSGRHSLLKKEHVIQLAIGCFPKPVGVAS